MTCLLQESCVLPFLATDAIQVGYETRRRRAQSCEPCAAGKYQDAFLVAQGLSCKLLGLGVFMLAVKLVAQRVLLLSMRTIINKHRDPGDGYNDNDSSSNWSVSTQQQHPCQCVAVKEMMTAHCQRESLKFKSSGWACLCLPSSFGLGSPEELSSWLLLQCRRCRVQSMLWSRLWLLFSGKPIYAHDFASTTNAAYIAWMNSNAADQNSEAISRNLSSLTRKDAGVHSLFQREVCC